MRPRGLPLQGVDKGCQKGAHAGENLLEDLRCDLTFLKQLRFSNGISGVHGSAPSGAYIFVSRPQKDFIHNGLDRVNEAKTVEPGSLGGCEPVVTEKVVVHLSEIADVHGQEGVGTLNNLFEHLSACLLTQVGNDRTGVETMGRGYDVHRRSSLALSS